MREPLLDSRDYIDRYRMGGVSIKTGVQAHVPTALDLLHGAG